MRPEKRMWLYAGLSVPRGVALVRRFVEAEVAEQRLLLLGDRIATLLTPFLVQLATDAKMPMLVATSAERLAGEWLRGPHLDHHLANFRPTVVVAAFENIGRESEKQMSEKISDSGAYALWVYPEALGRAPEFGDSNAFFLPSDAAFAYAALCGAVWSVVR